VSREIIAEYGVRGHRRVLVIRDKAKQRVYVERYVGGTAKREPRWPLTRENERLAKAWAETYYKAPTADRKAATVRDVWTAYWSMRRDGLRPRTQILYAERWERFERVALPETPAERVTLAVVDEFWKDALASGTAPNQVRACITVAKLAFRWAESRELIAVNKVALWKMPDGEQYRPKQIDEYRSDDADRMLAHCSPQDHRTWRPSVLLTLLADHGFRINAALHLTWSDIDFAAGMIRLRPEWDKRKRGWERPMTDAAYAALLTARWWATHLKSAAPWVFFKGHEANDAPYTYQAAHIALLKLEERAGIPHKKYRAFHGLRRMAVGNVRQQTGDVSLGLLWVGDHDVRQAAAYSKERPDEIRRVSDQVGAK
jgi:integrase